MVRGDAACRRVVGTGPSRHLLSCSKHSVSLWNFWKSKVSVLAILPTSTRLSEFQYEFLVFLFLVFLQWKSTHRRLRRTAATRGTSPGCLGSFQQVMGVPLGPSYHPLIHRIFQGRINHAAIGGTTIYGQILGCGLEFRMILQIHRTAVTVGFQSLGAQFSATKDFLPSLGESAVTAEFVWDTQGEVVRSCRPRSAQNVLDAFLQEKA